MNRLKINLRSLPAQLLLSFVALVLLTAATSGLPAILLIRGQLDRQAWAQAEQGSLAVRALYDAKQNELDNLATLTAQRPTLSDLLGKGDPAALSAYLQTLAEGSGLDLVLVCSSGQLAAAHAPSTIPAGLCSDGAGSGSGFHTVPGRTHTQVWLVGAYPLGAGVDQPTGMVFVGLDLDDPFAEVMRAQTGLEHTLVVDGQPVATSLPGRESWPCADLVTNTRSAFSAGDRRYLSICSLPSGTGLRAEVALDVTEASATLTRLMWLLAGSIFVVAALASLLGLILARRIGRPLTRLAEAAETMSQGDLETPVAVEARVREVTLLAHTLDGAREDLKQTLADLRQEKAWTDHLLEAIVEGIVTLDRRGHITFFSHGAERITGWRREEVMDRSCDLVFEPLDSRTPFTELMPAPGRRKKIPVELRDGRQAILAVTGAKLVPPEGKSARVALVFRDISEEEAVHRLLGLFLANVAHEFRTPLSALAASVELLMDQAPDLSATELQELLNSLHLGVLGLQTLIDNLLESASIEAGHFRVHPRACAWMRSSRRQWVPCSLCWTNTNNGWWWNCRQRSRWCRPTQGGWRRSLLTSCPMRASTGRKWPRSRSAPPFRENGSAYSWPIWGLACRWKFVTICSGVLRTPLWT